MADSPRELSEKWTQKAIETSLQCATPAVADERVFVCGLGETVSALSRADGSVLWSKARDGALSDSSACYHEEQVFVGGGGGTVYAFAAVDGTEHWTYSGESAITSSPVVRDGIVYVGRNDGELLALSAEDGSVIWQDSLGSPVYSALGYSASEEAVYVSTSGGAVHARDAVDGRERWSQSFGVAVGSSSPVVDDQRGLVYFAASEVMALAADDGETVWGTSFYGACAGSSPVFDGETVYVGGGDGVVYAIPKSHELLVTSPDWTFQTWDVSIVADPALAGNRLAVASLDGTLYILDTDSGTELGSLSLGCQTRSSPVIVDDEVYLGGEDGTVCAYEL